MITFFAIKKFFKKYWAIFAGGIAIVAYFFWKKKPDSGELAPAVRQSGKQLAQDIDAVRQNEQVAVDNEIKVHQQNSEEIKSKYEEKKNQLDEETKEEADRLFEEHKDNPEKLAEELSKVTGFRIILPKD